MDLNGGLLVLWGFCGPCGGSCGPCGVSRGLREGSCRSSSGLTWALLVVHGPFGGPEGIVGGLWAVWGAMWSDMGVI